MRLALFVAIGLAIHVLLSVGFVLTVGKFASREEAQNAGAVLYGHLGLTGVTKKLPPAPAP